MRAQARAAEVANFTLAKYGEARNLAAWPCRLVGTPRAPAKEAQKSVDMLELAALLGLSWWRIRHPSRRVGFKPALPMNR